MKYYAGIGSRETPDNVIEQMEIWAKFLFKNGYVLRSGGAPGADQAFERGLAAVNVEIIDIFEHAEIYLPWASFELANRTFITPIRDEPQEDAYNIAAKFHPNWKYLKWGAKKLHARNVHQVLGYDVTEPTLSDFILCWTRDGKEVGGTAQALRIAKYYEVPIFNLGGSFDVVNFLESIQSG